jgi:peptide/nickel transport system permease protein
VTVVAPAPADQLAANLRGPFARRPRPLRRPRVLKGIPGLVIRRLLLGLLTIFVASLLIFAATQALPSDAARSILGKNATPDSLADLRLRLGLEKPVVEQYTHWIGGVATGDLGTSLASNEPVTDVLGERLGNSLVLMLIAGLISIPLAVTVGVASARYRDSPFDHIVSIVLLGLAALPEFVVAIALVVLFSTAVLHVLPGVSVIPPGESPLADPQQLILPVTTLVIAVTPYITRMMRASMIEVLESEYVAMARLKGASERRVLWRHAVPNAIAPTLQVVALSLAWLAGGIVVVEFVFNYPGIGAGFLDAVQSRDLPVVQALALLLAALYVFLNLLADVGTIIVSPRLRSSLK